MNLTTLIVSILFLIYSLIYANSWWFETEKKCNDKQK